MKMKKNDVERAVENINAETSNIINDSKEMIIELKEWHSKEYLNKKLETTYKGKEVVFILPNGQEFKNEESRKRN